MTKTAIDIDRSIADETREILGTRTLTATVNTALQEIVNREKRERLIETLKMLAEGDLDNPRLPGGVGERNGRTASADEKARFLASLRSDPEFLEEVRREVLTRELLTLPETAARQGDVSELTRRMDQLTATVAELTRRMDQLAERMDRAERHLNYLRGDSFERQWREKAAAYLGSHGFRRIRLLTTSEVADFLDDAMDAGSCDDLQRDAILLLDGVHRALRQSDGAEVFVAAEVSARVDAGDIERARNRAAALGEVTGIPTIGVVVGASLHELTKQAAENAGLIVIVPANWADEHADAA